MREKLDCLEGKCVAYVWVPFTDGVVLYYSRCSTNWMMPRIRSHWLGYFLLLSISNLVVDIERTIYLG